MKIRLLYFAAVRDLLGLGEEDVVVPPEVASVGALAAWLAEHRPALAPRLEYVRFARNEAFATSDEALADGDVVAIIPPVAGG